MAQFANKVVMITGASGGLGSVVTRRFAEAGATLVLADRQQARLDTLLETLDGDHMGIVADLGDPTAVQASINEIEATGKTIDVLIHTVGGFAGGKPMHETELADFQKQMLINAQAIFVTAGAVAAHMVRHNHPGKLVLTLSKLADKGGKNLSVASASKAAARSLMESMAAELNEHNITVNAVSPSTIDTPNNRKAMPNADFAKWVTPDQIVDAMMFLASDAAERVSGVNLQVFG